MHGTQPNTFYMRQRMEAGVRIATSFFFFTPMTAVSVVPVVEVVVLSCCSSPSLFILIHPRSQLGHRVPQKQRV